MADVRADPVELAQLSQDCLGIAKDTRNALRALRTEALIPTPAFGNSTRADEVDTAYTGLLQAAGLAVEDLAEILEGDTDRLLRVAFAYKQTDDEEAERQANAPRN